MKKFGKEGEELGLGSHSSLIRIKKWLSVHQSCFTEKRMRKIFSPERKMRHFLMCDPLLDDLDDLVLGKNGLIAGLFLYTAFLYPVSTMLRKG